MSSQTLNVILFGETGTGKSSVINLMARRPIAKTSSGVDLCTTKSKDYQFNIGPRQIKIWDTIGLNKPQMAGNRLYDTITRGIALIREVSKAGGVDLLLLCIGKNRITATTRSIYRLFYEALCQKQVPIALVITHLERENPMEDWWTRNEASISGYGIGSVGHACVTCLEEHQKYKESRVAMLHLLSQQHSNNHRRFSMPPESGFTRFRSWTGSPIVKEVARILEK